jgi:Spy/CpxP family protein refolding chaperone
LTFPIAILLLLLLALVAYFVSAPIRASARAPEQDSAPSSTQQASTHDGSVADRDELEAAREAKYREIRDAEMDYRTGKLSSEDYEVIDEDLRAEALEILDKLEIQTDADEEHRGSDEEHRAEQE